MGPVKYPREEIGDPRNTDKKKFEPHKIPTRKKSGPTIYPREKIEDPRNNHEKKWMTHELPMKARWYDGTRPTRPMMARDPLNLAHSYMGKYVRNSTGKQYSISYSEEELAEL